MFLASERPVEARRRSYPILRVAAKSADGGRNRGELEVVFLSRLENDFSFDMSVLGRFLNVALSRLAFFSPRLGVGPDAGDPFLDLLALASETAATHTSTGTRCIGRTQINYYYDW
jgi:hypothetical protein